MNIFVDDNQVVGELESVLLELLQQGPVNSLFILQNQGQNTINYRFQEFNGTTWVDIGSPGAITNTTLVAAEVKSLKLTSSYPQVRLVGNASGGAILQFSITRFFNRANGGTIPILQL